ncbi:MAG: hypothetical protein KDD60_07475, partial [Bdellovibrionales bacterium]|nr:hypothetical protein [Bdellovibrionales bacterium]
MENRDFAYHEQCIQEEGITLVEVLVSIVLIVIMAIAGISNLVVALRTSKLTEVNHAATSLAISKVEQLASIDVLDLDAGDGGTENSVTWSDFTFTFTRVTTVTVNADNSRT